MMIIYLLQRGYTHSNKREAKRLRQHPETQDHSNLNASVNEERGVSSCGVGPEG